MDLTLFAAKRSQHALHLAQAALAQPHWRTIVRHPLPSPTLPVGSEVEPTGDPGIVERSESLRANNPNGSLLRIEQQIWWHCLWWLEPWANNRSRGEGMS